MDCEPKLRFPEFSEEWENKRLGEIAEFLDGKRIPLKSSDRAKRNGPYPYYGASGIIDYVDDYIFDEELVLLGEDGANIITRSSRMAFLARGKYWVNNHAHVIKGLDDTNQYFLSEQLERVNYTKYNTGTAQPKLNQDVCKKIPLKMPKIQEQRKIASFLSKVDERIEKLEKKQELWETYKKGVMHQIFSQKLRFKDENGEDYFKWEEKKLGEICFPITKGTTPSSIGFNFVDEGINFVKTENITKNGLINIKDTPKISTECDEKLSRSKLEENDILFSIAGTLGRTLIIKNNYLPANTNQALAIVRLKDKSQVKFINFMLNQDKIKKYIYISVTVGAQPNLSLKQISDIKLNCPSANEQYKISSFLSALDNKIEKITKEIELFNEFKKGLLQQMFC